MKQMGFLRTNPSLWRVNVREDSLLIKCELAIIVDQYETHVVQL